MFQDSVIVVEMFDDAKTDDLVERGVRKTKFFGVHGMEFGSLGTVLFLGHVQHGKIDVDADDIGPLVRDQPTEIPVPASDVQNAFPRLRIEPADESGIFLDAAEVPVAQSLGPEANIFRHYISFSPGQRSDLTSFLIISPGAVSMSISSMSRQHEASRTYVRGFPRRKLIKNIHMETLGGMTNAGEGIRLFNLNRARELGKSLFYWFHKADS
jgi:hypothetical protein